MLKLEMMKEIIYETILRLEAVNKAKGVSPDHVLYLELKNELAEMRKAALTELWEEKKIKSGHTKNDLYIRSTIKPQSFSPHGENDQESIKI